MTTPEIIRYSSQQDYLNKKASVAKNAAAKTANTGVEKNQVAKAAEDMPAKVPVEDGASKVELSEESKELSKETSKEMSTQAKNQAGGELGKGLLKGLPTPGLPVPLPAVGGAPAKAAKTDGVKNPGTGKTPELLQEPGIFFISGLNMFSSDKKGVEDLSQGIPGSQVYKWDKEEDILKQIKKHHPSQPIILVGHSLGGDTAVNLVKRLDSAENGFRKVDLLVTMDALGLNHDIIPKNVVKHLNFMGDDTFFLNDGPHIARDVDATEVINELRTEGHTTIDDSYDVQFKIFENINETLMSWPDEADSSEPA